MSDVSGNPLFLPEELIYNILLRLPVRSVLVCTSVCKAWNSFIKSPSLVPSHLSRTISSYKENDTRLYLVQLGPRPSYYGSACSFSLRSDDEKFSEYSPIHFPYKHIDGFQVISSCNGLVLLKIGYLSTFNHLILWNPVIRKSVIIAKRKEPEFLESVGLGFDSRTCDYKVLAIFAERYEGDLKLELYSLKTNSWKRLPDVVATLQPQWRFSFRREMIYLNGALHYIAMRESGGCRYLILAFDLDGEVFREIELPDCMSRVVDDDRMYLWAYKESLSVFWSRKTDRGAWECQILVMDKYGVSESWTQLYIFSQENSNIFRLLRDGLVYRNDGSVVFSTYVNEEYPWKMFSHDLKSQKIKLVYLDEKLRCYSLDNYVESLVLLDKGDDLSTVSYSCNSDDLSSGDDLSESEREDATDDLAANDEA